MFRRAVLLLLFLLLLLPVIVHAEENGSEVIYAYFRDARWLRSEPAPGTPTVANVPERTMLRLEPLDDKYAYTTYKGAPGYIYYKDYVTVKYTDPHGPDAVTVEGFFGAPVYMRQSPLKNASLVALLPTDERFQITFVTDEYAYIVYEGQEGYILRKHLIPAPECEPVETKQNSEMMTRAQILGDGNENREIVLDWKEFNVAVLASYDWATAQHDKVVISTFHSPLERDVMDFLLQKKQPFIFVLTARMYKRVPARLQEALNEGRLLLISLQSDNVRMYSQDNANRANRYILSLTHDVVFGSIEQGSNTEQLYQSLDKNDYNTTILAKP